MSIVELGRNFRRLDQRSSGAPATGPWPACCQPLIMVVLCHANVRSLVAEGRKKEVEELARHNGIDILCLTETWLKPKHLDSTLMILGFQKPFRLDWINSRGPEEVELLCMCEMGLQWRNCPCRQPTLSALVCEWVSPRGRKQCCLQCTAHRRQLWSLLGKILN